MELQESTGYKSLLVAVTRDTEYGEKCLNLSGCNHEFYNYGNGCRRVSKCFHKYCDKFAWVVERAKHYAEKTGLDAGAILDAWETGRSYWYINYYQDANQPMLDTERVKVFDTQDDLMIAIGEGGFRCPACGGVSKSPYECTTGTGCDWKVYGLFADLGKGVFVFCKEKARGETIFTPVAWEHAAQHDR
jgi:hypothetical protein